MIQPQESKFELIDSLELIDLGEPVSPEILSEKHIRKIPGKPTTVIVLDTDSDASSDLFEEDDFGDYEAHDSSDEDEIVNWNLENDREKRKI